VHSKIEILQKKSSLYLKYFSSYGLSNNDDSEKLKNIASLGACNSITNHYIALTFTEIQVTT